MGKTKTKKMLGKKTFGYGSKKKHRGKGSKGGSGFAGSKKHNKSKILKENPKYFEHKKLKSRKTPEKIINIKDLEKFKENKINLKELGYTKLLGDGEVNKKLEVVVDKFSKQAEEKIKNLGGKITSPEEKVKAEGKIAVQEGKIKKPEKITEPEKKVKK